MNIQPVPHGTLHFPAIPVTGYMTKTLPASHTLEKTVTPKKGSFPPTITLLPHSPANAAVPATTIPLLLTKSRRANSWGMQEDSPTIVPGGSTSYVCLPVRLLTDG